MGFWTLRINLWWVNTNFVICVCDSQTQMSFGYAPMSSTCADAADSYRDHDAEQAIGGTTFCEWQQGDKGAKGSRTSNRWHCIMRTMARGDSKGKRRGVKGARDHHQREGGHEISERGGHTSLHCWWFPNGEWKHVWNALQQNCVCHSPFFHCHFFHSHFIFIAIFRRCTDCSTIQNSTQTWLFRLTCYLTTSS